jgi:hypothetical protein
MATETAMETETEKGLEKATATAKERVHLRSLCIVTDCVQ